MEDKEYISGPRPMWREEDAEESRSKRRITLGTSSSGVVVCVTKEGIEFNGYYAGSDNPTKYANVREFVLVSWEELNKMKISALRREPVKKKIIDRQPDFIDETPDEHYLEKLPIVTLNSRKYYIDVERQERRPVDKPDQVFNFEKQAAKE